MVAESDPKKKKKLSTTSEPWKKDVWCVQYSIWQRKENTKSAYTILLKKENTWHPKDFECHTFIHLNKCRVQGPSNNKI